MDNNEKFVLLRRFLLSKQLKRYDKEVLLEAGLIEPNWRLPDGNNFSITQAGMKFYADEIGGEVLQVSELALKTRAVQDAILRDRLSVDKELDYDLPISIRQDLKHLTWRMIAFIIYPDDLDAMIALCERRGIVLSES